MIELDVEISSNAIRLRTRKIFIVKGSTLLWCKVSMLLLGHRSKACSVAPGLALGAPAAQVPCNGAFAACHHCGGVGCGCAACQLQSEAEPKPKHARPGVAAVLDARRHRLWLLWCATGVTSHCSQLPSCWRRACVLFATNSVVRCCHALQVPKHKTSLETLGTCNFVQETLSQHG